MSLSEEIDQEIDHEMLLPEMSAASSNERPKHLRGTRQQNVSSSSKVGKHQVKEDRKFVLELEAERELDADEVRVLNQAQAPPGSDEDVSQTG